MNPSHDERRRQAWAQALNTTLVGNHAVIYANAAQNREQQCAIMGATSRNNLRACASLGTDDMTASEEVIAFALTQPGVQKVVTDSQQAYRNYQSGLVYRPALRV